jgi:hypothetical protein
MNPIAIRVYWQATAALLAAHFGGWQAGLPLAIALNLAQALHFSAVRRSGRALDVQVRWLYLALLLLGTVPPLAWLHALQAAGLFALLVADYCLAARLLVLMPWNRRVPFSAGLLLQVLRMPPRPGSIAERLPLGDAAPFDAGATRRR